MAVYVDNGQFPYGRMKMAHMLADTLNELHDMADRLGLKRGWFQNHSAPHYDLCQAKRRLAIEYGAIEINRRELVTLIRVWRERLAVSEPMLEVGNSAN